MLALWLAAAPGPPAGPAALFNDPQRGVEVRYSLTAASVAFSAYLPAGWSFSVAIDGDRNGAWGNGAGPAAAVAPTSPDRKFGQEALGGVFCAQYILASRPDHPDEVLISSDCDAYPSLGRVELSQIDSGGRATITYRIPTAEVFGRYPSAHLQVCVWDTKKWGCQHSPKAPFVLPGPVPGAAAEASPTGGG